MYMVCIHEYTRTCTCISACTQSSEVQQNLLDLFGEDMNTTESSAVGDSGSDDTAGREDTASLEDSKKKNKKRKRMTVEPYSDDDPDFSPHTGKQKKNSETCRSSRQRTLTAMTSESNSGGRGKGRLKTTEHCEPSKAANLASYLLSQQSLGGVCTSTTSGRFSDSTVESSTSGATTSIAVGNDAVAVQRKAAAECDGQVYVESHTNCRPHTKCTQCQSTHKCHPTCGAARGFSCKTACPVTHDSVSESDSGWLDGLRDCDLSSFDNFDDCI